MKTIYTQAGFLMYQEDTCRLGNPDDAAYCTHVYAVTNRKESQPRTVLHFSRIPSRQLTFNEQTLMMATYWPNDNEDDISVVELCEGINPLSIRLEQNYE